MSAEDIARQVAGEFSGEFGSQLKDEVDKILAGQVTRNLLTQGAELAAIAHFVFAIAPAVVAKLKTMRSPAELRSEVSKEIPRPSKLDPATADRMIDATIEKAKAAEKAKSDE